MALGSDLSDEHRPNLHQLSKRLKGNMGLFFTKLPREQVQWSAGAGAGWGGVG